MERRSSWTLTLSFAASVLLHLLGAWAILASRAGAMGTTSPLPEGLFEEPEPLEEELHLGSMTSDAATMVWIGYDEYEEHLARPSETDQAAFDPAPPGPLGDEPDVVEVDVEPVPTETPAPEAVETAETAESAAEEAPSPTPVMIVEGPMGPPAPPAPEVSETPLEELGPLTPARVEELLATSETEGTEQVDATAESSPPTPKEQGADPGNEADKEALATSIKQALKWKPGKPLAAEGLEIRTVAPKFGKYTSLTRRLDPVIRVWFNKSGSVHKCEILQSSENGDVDRNCLDALYQWRARGAVLDEMKVSGVPATISVDVRIVF